MNTNEEFILRNHQAIESNREFHLLQITDSQIRKIFRVRKYLKAVYYLPIGISRISNALNECTAMQLVETIFRFLVLRRICRTSLGTIILRLVDRPPITPNSVVKI